MVVKKKVAKRSAIKASNTRLNRRRRVRAAEDTEIEEESVVDVDPEASDLLFEAEDVAQLVAEVTGKDVAVTSDEDVVVFEVGDDEFTVEAEGDEEILEATRKPLRGKAPVKASRRVRRTRR